MSKPETNGETDSESDKEEQPHAIYPNQGPDREGMVSDYLPEQNDWEAKTNIDLNDPAAIAALENMDQMFPEVDDLQPLIDDFLHHFLKSKTSVKGQSRQEYTGIMKAMFGQGDGDGESKSLQLVAADDD